MRALVYDPDAPEGIRLAMAPNPTLTASQVLVRVQAVSLNFGEVAFMAERSQPGAVSGWDAAGVVVESALDGSGPPVGTRVVTFAATGGWAELRAAETADLAVLPDSVDVGEASVLPVAGVTALQALRRLGAVLGRRVLITGASGGVGRMAVQLAALAGAQVIASVGKPARAEGLAEIGADEVVVGLEDITEPVFGVLDNVGGTMLGKAFNLLDEGGCVQAIGVASGQPTVLADLEQQRIKRDRTRLETFRVRRPFGSDLNFLMGLLEKGKLDPQIGWRGSWERAPEAAAALLGRRVLGKAVLDVTASSSGA